MVNISKKDKKNTIYNIIGSMAIGFTSLIFTMIVTHCLTIDDVALFSYSYGIACVLFTIAFYSGRTFQVSDYNNKYCDTDYIYNKYLTFIIMLIVCFLFCIFNNYSMYKTSIIFIITIYRGIDSFIDCYQAITQKNGYLYKTAISSFIRAICLSIVFLIVTLLFKNLIISCLFLIFVSLFFLISLDMRETKKYIVIKKFDSRVNINLLRDGFLVFLFTFLSLFLMNIPRYIVDGMNNSSLQAIYGTMVLPATFVSLISNYLIQSLLVNISDNLKNQNFAHLFKIVKKLFIIVFVFGIICSIGAYILGIPFLQILYGIDLNKQSLNLFLIIVGSTFYSLAIISSNILIAMRKNLAQIIILVICSICSYILCIILINKYLMFGAAISYMISMLIQFILYYIYLINILRRKI